MNAAITWLRANAWTWATTAWDWISWAFLAVWRSFAALLKSPAAWLACSVVFAAGFCIGHIERGSDVRSAQMAVAGLTHENKELNRQLDASKTKVRMLVDQLEKLAQKPQEAAPLVSAPTPAAKPRRAPRATPAPAKAGPAPAVRNPFEG